MSASSANFMPDDASRTFSSSDTTVLINDEPGDTTVQPPPPVLLRLAQAERERIAAWAEAQKANGTGKKEPDQGP